MASWIEELHFPDLNIPITIDHVIPVLPSGPIPAVAGDSLYLSNLDDVVGARVFTPTVYFYQSINFARKPVGQVLRDALASVLVPYYPFSARLRETGNGKLEVYFGPNQGALFVEAHSGTTIENLGSLSVPNPAWAPLIYRFPSEDAYKVIDMPLVIAQVTSFSCGGFSLGLRLCHCLADGLGAMQFVNAWAATARSGFLVTNPKPCWEREFFKPREPPVVKFPHLEYKRMIDGSSLTATLWRSKPVQKCYRLSEGFQARLKQGAQPDDGRGCTSFDALAAHVWRAWVKALNVTPLDYQLRLTFSVNARQKCLNPPLKDGFYGNVVCVACTTSTVSQLVQGQLSTIAQLVRDARQNVTEEYARSTVDYIEVDRPMGLEFAGKLTITQWTRFSMYESADFGWGLPLYAGPIDLTPTPQVCVILPDGETVPSPNRSIVVCICLSEAAASKFKECLLEIP